MDSTPSFGPPAARHSEPAADSNLLTPGLTPGGTATRFFVVRHGETDWNVGNRIQGHHQTKLNERGRAQARQVAAHLAGCGIQHIYSSDLDRATETAAAISEATGRPVTTRPELRERDFGPLAGTLFADAIKLRDAAVRSEADPTEWAGVEGVESDLKMIDRLWSFLRPLPERHAGETVLIVTHGGILRVLMLSVMGIEPGKPWRAVLKNAAVNIFEVHGGVWRLRTFGMEV